MIELRINSMTSTNEPAALNVNDAAYSAVMGRQAEGYWTRRIRTILLRR